MSDPWDDPSAYEGQVNSGFSEQARRAEFPMSPTPNPQETVVCPKAHCKCMYGENRGCRNHHYGQGCPPLAEPHVVQVPQESSTGKFEASIREGIATARFGGKGGLAENEAVAAILAAHQKEIQAAKREAYNDVWQGFKQQYTGTKWEQEMEPWLRSFVVMTNITSKHLGESE